MAFPAFNLFSDVARGYSNYENIRDIGRNLDVGSGLSIVTNGILGLSPGNTISQLLRVGLGGFGFLVDTVTGERLIFQYNVVGKESGGAEYETQNVLGRSVPRQNYKFGKLRTLSLPITFTMRDVTRQDIRTNIRWLQALSYPDYNGTDEISMAPHPVVLIQGQLYSQDVWVVTDFGIEYSQAVDPITLLPIEATVTLTLVEVADRAKSRSEVIRL